MTNPCRFPLIALALAFVLSAAGVRANGTGAAIVFFGDSLTAGYGVEPEQAYPALIQQEIREAGLDFEVVNSGLSGETTAAGARRVDWILRRPAAVFVLALGGNDGLRGVPVEETENNLSRIIETVQKQQPQARIILAGMQAPPNMGLAFTSKFRALFPRLAERYSLPLVPFLLEGVGGVFEYNLADGIHPNPKGHQIVADNIWPILEPVLKEIARN
ncbi:MAG: arylesterase [Opitutaceae bacterium]